MSIEYAANWYGNFKEKRRVKKEKLHMTLANDKCFQFLPGSGTSLHSTAAIIILKIQNRLCVKYSLILNFN